MSGKWYELKEGMCISDWFTSKGAPPWQVDETQTSLDKVEAERKTERKVLSKEVTSLAKYLACAEEKLADQSTWQEAM